jgi:hypothetical protein
MLVTDVANNVAAKSSKIQKGPLNETQRVDLEMSRRGIEPPTY